MTERLDLRVFISSPSDVADEREHARAALRRLQKERPFKDRIHLQEISWDDPDTAVPLDGHLTPQKAIERQLPKPSECDVVIVILWSRMGTPLPADCLKPDGSRYRSGTEYEYCDAIAGAVTSRKPCVWLYRRTEEPRVGVRDPHREEKLRQADAVESFFAEFRDESGALHRTAFPYEAPDRFRDLVEGHLRDWMTELLRKETTASSAVNARHDAAPLPLDPDPRVLNAYREASLSLHSRIHLAGFKTKLRVPIDLEDLYVPLHAHMDLRATGHCTFADAAEAEAELRQRGAGEIPLIGAFREMRRRKRRGLVILGDPGSGKTTHLERLLVACLREGPASLGLPADMLPVFLPLRELEDLDSGIDAFIESTLESPHFKMPEGFGSRLLDRGHLLLLFDGLDEVSDPARRSQVSHWIEEAARLRPSCTAVVSCRFAGYDEASQLGAEFLQLHLLPLTSEQSASFIENWYRAVETGLAMDPEQGETTARARAQELVERLKAPDFRSARMAEMTRNPLLLANLCLVHRDRGTLPHNRHQLYDECIEVLLERWREAKRLGIRVSAHTGRRVLQPAALWLHGVEGRTRAGAAELAPIIEPALQAANWPGGDGAAFLRAVRDDSGLLTGWGPDQFGFMHLGFQEYLAACELRRLAFEGDKEKIMGQLSGHYGESWWQEVILLLLAQGNPSLFAPFMAQAIAQPAFVTDAALLGLILEEATEKSTEPFAAWLQHMIERPAPDEGSEDWQRILNVVYVLKQLLSEEALNGLLTPLFQAAKPRMRAWLQQRYQKTAVEHGIRFTENGAVELVLVPGGRFLMGSPAGKGHEAEHPQHEVALKPFYLGRYPVTNEEYWRFLQANPAVKEPKYWADRRFNQARQPVVGVDWQDARRFCAWAGGRLPTEAEWEYACRAGTQTEYFWGEDGAVAGDFAWFDEPWDKGASHPVGEKAPNPWGLHDLAGNVLEWVEDEWHDDYQGAPGDGSARQGGSGGRRVIRGGAWYYAAESLRSAYRFGYAPVTRDVRLGFRLAQDLP